MCPSLKRKYTSSLHTIASKFAPLYMESHQHIDLSPDFLPHYLQPADCASKAKGAVVKKQFLVFNKRKDQSQYRAILVIKNPSVVSAVVYKLSVDGFKSHFQINSWEGCLEANSRKEVIINVNVLSPIEPVSSCISLRDLCATKFHLEMMDSTTTEECLLIQIELPCITSTVLGPLLQETSLPMTDLIGASGDIEPLIAKFVQASLAGSQKDAQEVCPLIAEEEEESSSEPSLIDTEGDDSFKTEESVQDMSTVDELEQESQVRVVEGGSGVCDSMAQPGTHSSALFALLKLFLEVVVKPILSVLSYLKLIASKADQRSSVKKHLA